MNSTLASNSALAMRRRILRRKRVERVAKVVHHIMAVLGVVFLLALTVGALP